MSWISRRLRRAEDEGFSIVEAIVALVLIAIVMMGFSVAAIGSVRAGMVARQNQQSGDLLTKSVEQMRALSYSVLAMDPTDIAGTDGGLLASCGVKTCLNLGGGKTEPLLVASGGGLLLHTQTYALNKVVYTIRRYVTSPTDTEAGASYKRITAFVQWTAVGRFHSRSISSLVASTRRGLPLPYYKFTPVGPSAVTVNPSATVLFGVKVTNNGARDTWNLTNDTPALGWSWVFDDGDNTYDATKDTVPVTDTTGDGIRDTGAIEPTKSVVVWLIRTVPASPAGPYSSVTKVTATSFAQATSFSTLSTAVNVQSGVVVATPTPTASATASPTPTASASSTCPVQASVPTPTGVTQTAYWMHNVATSTALSNSTAQDPMVLGSSTVPNSSVLYDYSTDDGVNGSQIQAGRVLRPSSLGAAETNVLKKADFRFRLTANRTINGTITATTFAVPQSGLSTDGVHLKFILMTASKSGSSYVWTQRAVTSYDAATWGCGTFNKLTVGLPVNFALKNNDYFDLYVQNTGTNDVRLGYDTAAQNANVVVPLS